MQIPELMQVGDDTYINPLNITSIKDYTKRLVISTTGGKDIEVKEDWVGVIRSTILHNNTTTTEDEQVQDVEFTEIDDGKDICELFKGCSNISKRDDLCALGEGGKPINCAQYDEATKETELTKLCPIAEHCSSTDCKPDDKEHNVPKCFRFNTEPLGCGECPLLDICGASGTGTCPIDEQK